MRRCRGKGRLKNFRMSIEVKNVTKKFGNFAALDHVNLKVESGELVALLGPSGSGKTTLLRIIAGLEFPDPADAQVLFYGEDVTAIPASQRQAGFAFQHYALFRHMNVFENIAFGLRVRPKRRGPARNEIRARVGELLKLMQLDRSPSGFPRNCPADSGSASPSPARSRSSRRCCCWTNRSARSTRRSARNCAGGCGSCTTKSTSPRFRHARSGGGAGGGRPRGHPA